VSELSPAGDEAMTSHEIDDDDPHGRLLTAITRELAVLAENLPGPLRRVAMTANGHAIEVEWATDPPAPAAWQPPAGTTDPPTTPTTTRSDTRWQLRAPLVGTFYAAPEPNAAPFVRPGDLVEEGQTVAIIEAMKLMNQVTVELPGRVVEVLVRNGDGVEYDQPLIVLEPAGGPS
jgi:acetyl-CoA carboxylase biotin carboxyl carrier protein